MEEIKKYSILLKDQWYSII